MRYREWKAKTMAALIALSRETNQNAKNDIRSLMRKLRWLKSRDLALWLSDLYHAAENEPRLLELAPSAEQVDEWFSRDED